MLSSESQTRVVAFPTRCCPSFSKGPRREKRLKNLARVPKLLGKLQELQVPEPDLEKLGTRSKHGDAGTHHGSLSSLTGRTPDLRLGIGLPMSRLYSGECFVLTW
jgi:pyruvate dehydrogenase kinase 2/3/4